MIPRNFHLQKSGGKPEILLRYLSHISIDHYFPAISISKKDNDNASDKLLHNDTRYFFKITFYFQNKVINDAGSIKRRKSYLITEPLSTSEWENIPPKMRQICDGLPVVWTKAISETSEVLQEGVEVTPEVKMYINYTSKNIMYSPK